MICSASAMMRSISSFTVGMSWIRPDHHAAAPGAGIHFAVDHHLRIDARDLLVDVLDLEACPLLPFDLEQLVDALVLQDPLGIAQRAHDQHACRARMPRPAPS